MGWPRSCSLNGDICAIRELREPVTGADSTQLGLAPRITGGRAWAGARVLVIEDEVDIREFVREALEQEGCEVRTATNGVEALQCLRESAPNLILLDMQMPVMDGWAFARAYCQSPPPHAPIVVITADYRAPTSATEIDAAGFLPKPFGLAELLAVVDYCLGGGHQG
ncbi:MAG: response regulator [Chloroflexi bacterium]|nr:response regulator [Chloroflexota bacterium]